MVLDSRNIKIIVALLMAALLMLGLVATVVTSGSQASASSTVEVTVEVKDSSGDPLAGVLVRHWRSGIGFGTLGSTDASGEVTGELAIDHTRPYTIIASYNRTQAQEAGIWVDATSDGTTIATFQTDAATIEVEDTNGVKLSDIRVRYWQPNIGFREVGRTDSEGIAETELFAGTYRFLAYLNHTQTMADVDITTAGPGDPDHTFQATVVNFRFSGNVRYHIPNRITGNVPSHLFPGTYLFGFSGPGYAQKWAWLTVPSGENMTKTVAYLRVVDSNGQGIAGLSARAHQEVFGITSVPGTTDGNGVLLHIRDGVWGHDREPLYAMRKGRTHQFDGRQNPALNSFFNFQTAELRVTVESSGGQYSVDNRQVQYHQPNGSGIAGYSAGWSDVGTTDANGEVSTELFPANGLGSRVWHPHVAGPNFDHTAAGTDITITIP